MFAGGGGAVMGGGFFTHTRASGVGALAPLPLNAKAAHIGDSITAAGYGVVSTEPYYFDGYTSWIDSPLGGKFYTPIGGNLGLAGETVQNFRANRLGEIPATCHLYRILFGTNDLGLNHRTAPQVIADLTALRDRIWSINPTGRISLVQLLPRFGGEALNGTDETARVTINAWIATQAADPRVVVTNTSSMVSGDFSDGLHPTIAGGKKLAALVSAAEAAWRPSASSADAFFAGAVLNSNPNWAGSTGALNNISGVLADGAAAFYSGSGVTVTASKDGSDAQVFSFSGTPSGSDILFVSMESWVAVGLSTGTPYEGMIEFEVTSPLANVAAIAFRAGMYNGAVSDLGGTYSYWAVTSASKIMPLDVGQRYTFRTPPRALQAGATYPFPQLRFLFDSAAGTPVTGAVKIIRTGMRAVPS